MIKENGITLITLIITVIILVLVAGISISQLSGNGLIGKTMSAREQAEIQGEKETIQAAIVNAKSKNRYGKLTKDELQQELNSNGNTAEVTKSINGLIVSIKETGRFYEISRNGSVSKVDEVPAYLDIANGSIEISNTGYKIIYTNSETGAKETTTYEYQGAYIITGSTEENYVCIMTTGDFDITIMDLNMDLSLKDGYCPFIGNYGKHEKRITCYT